MQGKTARVYTFIALVALVIAAGAMLLPTIASSTDAGPRDIHLVVRNMTYYVAGDDHPNPTLKVRAGERIRLVLTNEDAGMDHDFRIEAWKVATKLLEGRGEDVVTFTVPERRGAEDYICTPHAKMMRGAIVVE